MARPKTSMISRSAAIEAALRLIDAEGYETFSFEKLARVMGVRGPSLYHHFANRSDLLAEASRRLLAEVSLPITPSPGDWHEWFVDLSVATYRQILRHPRAAGLVMSYFPNSVIMPAHERAAAILAAARVPAGDRWMIQRGLEKLVFGLAVADADSRVHGEGHMPAPAERDRYPYLMESLQGSEPSGTQAFERCVRCFLAGAAREMSSAVSSPPAASAPRGSREAGR